MSHEAGRSLLAVMTQTSKEYEDHIVFVESRRRDGGKQEAGCDDASEKTP
jgi:hypothetical protein